MSTLQTTNLKHPDASGNQITFTSAGNVGIGGSAPNYSDHNTLSVFGAANTGAGFIQFTDTSGNADGAIFVDDGHLFINADYDNTSSSSTIRFRVDGSSEKVRIDSSGDVELMQGNNLTWVFAGGSTHRARIRAESSDVLIFETGSGDAERLRINNADNGRILIGTSSIIGNTLRDSYYAKVTVVGRGDSTGNEGRIALVRDEGSATITANDNLGAIYFSDNQGGSYASIRAIANGTASGNDYPGALLFSTTRNGASAATERMRIQHNGWNQSVAVDHVQTNSSAAGAGVVYFFFAGKHSATLGAADSGTTSIAIYTNGNIVNTNNSYGPISDVKLKENIVDANSQWDDLKALRVVNFNFKQETGYETHKQLGFIAQEVEQVSPGLVYNTPDRDEGGNDLGTVTKVLQTSVLYTKAVKALQEAMERIETLEQRLADAGIA